MKTADEAAGGRADSARRGAEGRDGKNGWSLPAAPTADHDADGRRQGAGSQSKEYGINDWYTMLQHFDPLLQEYEESLRGDPVKDRTRYEAASPIRFLRNERAAARDAW